MDQEPGDQTGQDLGDEGGGDVEGTVEDIIDAVGTVVGDVVDDLGEAAEDAYETFRSDLLGRDGYLSVLVMTIVTMIVIPLGLLFRGGALLVSVSIALLVLTAMSRSKVNHLLRIISGAVTGSVVVVALYVTITGDHLNPDRGTWVQGTFVLLYTLVIALCFPVILRRAFSHKKVTLNTVAASLAAYLLIGLIFAGGYRFVQVISSPMFSQPGVNGFTYEYFSYITLSTVGYGDFTPANDGGRTLAMLEALLGQSFLVTIVAMVVANLGREHVQLRRRKGQIDDDDAGPAPSS
ncbi:MAG TPA: ion channel [Acidimicrobiales bacterium]